jgi:hypothetical protein
MENNSVVITREAVAAAARAEAAMTLPQRVALLEQMEAGQPALVAELLSGRAIGIPELYLDALLRILTVCFLTLRMSSIRWRRITSADLRDALEATNEIRVRHAAAAGEAERTAVLPRFDPACEPLIAYILGEANRCTPRVRSAVTEFMLVESVMLALCVGRMVGR